MNMGTLIYKAKEDTEQADTNRAPSRHPEKRARSPKACEPTYTYITKIKLFFFFFFYFLLFIDCVKNKVLFLNKHDSAKK